MLSSTETSESTKSGFIVSPIAGLRNSLLASAVVPIKASVASTSGGVVP